jgi:hypothetical protein
MFVSVVFNPDHGSNHIEFTRAQFSHRIAPGQAVKQFTSSSCSHFRKELKLLYITEQWYSANNRRNYFMINHNESDLPVRESNTGCPIHSPTLYLLSEPDDLVFRDH